MFMPGIGRQSFSGRQLHNRKPYRHKQLRLVPLTELLIDVLENFRRAAAHLGTVFNERLCDHHEQSGRDALAGYVRHDQAQMIVVNEEEIIKVSADFLGRGHGGVDFKICTPRERREDPREHIGLDLRCNVQLRPDAFPLGSDSQQIPNVRIHIVFHLGETAVKRTDLVL